VIGRLVMGAFLPARGATRKGSMTAESAMKFGIHIGHMGGPLGEMRQAVEVRRRARGSTGSPSPTTSKESAASRRGDGLLRGDRDALTAAAMDTTRIRLGSGVYCVAYRNPGLLAKSLTTIDHLSNGRVGLPGSAPAGTTRGEGLRIRVSVDRSACRGHARGVRADLASAPRPRNGARISGESISRSPTRRTIPKPLQPRIPIWIGWARRKAHAPAAAKYADGWKRRLHRPGRLEAQGPGARRVVREGRARPEDDHAHREPRLLPRRRRQGITAARRNSRAISAAATTTAPRARATCALREGRAGDGWNEFRALGCTRLNNPPSGKAPTTGTRSRHSPPRSFAAAE